MKKKVLFLCTGNSCRSQMAEALFNHYHHDIALGYSAGIVKHGLNPFMLKVLEEIKISTKSLYSKTIDDVKKEKFDLVITVCSNAKESCPVFPQQTKTIHHPFDDPPALAQNLIESEQLQIYRRVRDEIKAYIISKDFLI